MFIKNNLEIVGIDNEEGMNSKATEIDINKRNFENFNSKARLLHMYTNQHTGRDTVIMEVIAEIYKHLRESNIRIFVGYRICRVYDLINTKPCLKCSRFGHNGHKSRNEIISPKCTGKYDTSKCYSQDSKCTNCIFINKKFKANYVIDHSAMDMVSCQVCENKIEKLIESTNYPVKPALPSESFSSDMTYRSRQVQQMTAPIQQTSNQLIA